MIIKNIFETIVEAFLMGLINRYCSRRMNIKAHVPITRKYFPCKFRVLIEIQQVKPPQQQEPLFSCIQCPLVALGSFIFCHCSNIKNAVIGNKAKKSSFIRLDIIPKILQLLMQDDTGIDFVVESVVLLGSLARGRAYQQFPL